MPLGNREGGARPGPASQETCHRRKSAQTHRAGCSDGRLPKRSGNLVCGDGEHRGEKIMSRFLIRVFNDGTSDMRNKTLGMYGLLVGLNLFAWAWALVAFHDNAAMMGACLLAYSFGLRHAFDADHIAAIDNVTRKMMQEGKRPISVGFFFSLGHSMVVILLSIGIAVTASAIQNHFEQLKQVGGIVGTAVSALFLFAHRWCQHSGTDCRLEKLSARQTRRQTGRGRSRPATGQSRAAGAPVQAAVSPGRA